MEIEILLVFVSLVLAGGAVALFVRTVRERTYEHSDRLALLPMEEDAPPKRPAPPPPSP